MSEENISQNIDGVKRRTIIQGAAWSVPAIALVVAAPASAGSAVPCAVGSETIVVPAPRPVGSNMGDTTWTVPAGVTRIRFDVVGGGGGGIGAVGRGGTGNTRGGTAVGGSGAKVGGYVAVQPGDTVRLVAGAGGGATRTSKPTIAGGKGWGNGGDSMGWNTGHDGHASTSGGGGSAILVNGEVIAIAGGGGGASSFYGGAGVYYPRYDTTWSDGGNAGLHGGSAEAGGPITFSGNFPVSEATVPGGGGGTQSAGGLPGDPATWTGSNWTNEHNNSGGAAGGAPNPAGADGGDGIWIGNVIANLGDYLGTAGGGGGYSGGASGSYTSRGHHNGVTAQFHFTGGGGGAASYASPRVINPTSSIAGNGGAGTTAATRPGGSATIFAC